MSEVHVSEIVLGVLLSMSMAGLLLVVLWQRRDISLAMKIIASPGYQAFAQNRPLEAKADVPKRELTQEEIREQVEALAYEEASRSPMSGA